jgi:hypothetical protein
MLTRNCENILEVEEHGIEYGLQFVTHKYLNSPNFLYIKKSCKFLQSYKNKYEVKKNRTMIYKPKFKFILASDIN